MVRNIGEKCGGVAAMCGLSASALLVAKCFTIVFLMAGAVLLR